MAILKQRQNGEWVTRGESFPYKVGGLAPTGTVSISSNGTYDVSQYASAEVNVNAVDVVATGGISGAISGNAEFITTKAFYINGSITTVSFPVCKTIGSNAFYQCASLTSVSFPACTSIGSGAFDACNFLSIASFPVCEIIGGNAFMSCSAFTTVSFPACTTIGAYAFYQCSYLTSVSFPVCSFIGSNAFGFCTALTTASFPVCTSIRNYAFRYCSALASVSFPACTSISGSAFYSCYNLLSLYLLGSSVPTLSNVNAFTSTPISNYTTSTGGVYGSIIVQESMLSAFKTATNWSVYSSRFSVWNGVD